MAKAPRNDAGQNALAMANAVDDIVDEDLKKSLRLECRELEKQI
jgi:hypothetical protein